MYSIASVGVFLVALLFMSPLTLMALLGGGFVIEILTDLPGVFWIAATEVFSLLPIIAMILHATGKFMLGSSKSPAPPNVSK